MKFVKNKNKLLYRPRNRVYAFVRFGLSEWLDAGTAMSWTPDWGLGVGVEFDDHSGDRWR